MKNYLTISYIIFMLLVVSSCAEVSSEDSVTGNTNNSNNSNKVFTLSWTAPTSYENNNLLVPTNDLSEYRVYYGDSESNVTSNYISVSSNESSISTDQLDSNLIGSYNQVYIAMTAVSKDGVESLLSTVVNFTP